MSLIRKLCLVAIISVLIPSFIYSGRRHGDVDRIGIRNINGRIIKIFPNLVSLDKEIQIGQYYASMFEQTAPILEDPVITQYVSGLADTIAAHSDVKVPIVTKVVDVDEVNAFALPGGFLYVNRGLIMEAETESELAGVLAHEIAHVAARHATERMTKVQLMSFAALPALFVGGYWTQYGISNGLSLGLSLAVLGITRESEEEADQLGTQYLWNSGYDPEGFITFFRRLKSKDSEKKSRFSGFWRTHPYVDDRIDHVKKEISYLDLKDEMKVTTSLLSQIQERINKMNSPVKQRNDGQSGSSRPTLKRKTNTQTKDEQGTGRKTRPTLKRPISTS